MQKPWILLKGKGIVLIISINQGNTRLSQLQCQNVLDRLETLSEKEFLKDPEAIAAAKAIGIDVEFLSSGFMHDVE